MTEKICRKCKWKWDYTGKKKFTEKYDLYITCPRCKTPNKIKKSQQDAPISKSEGSESKDEGAAND